jgi:hypothetical protein
LGAPFHADCIALAELVGLMDALINGGECYSDDVHDIDQPQLLVLGKSLDLKLFEMGICPKYFARTTAQCSAGNSMMRCMGSELLARPSLNSKYLCACPSVHMDVCA